MQSGYWWNFTILYELRDLNSSALLGWKTLRWVNIDDDERWNQIPSNLLFLVISDQVVKVDKLSNFHIFPPFKKYKIDEFIRRKSRIELFDDCLDDGFWEETWIFQSHARRLTLIVPLDLYRLS